MAKGSVVDLIYLIVFIFIISIVVVLSHFINSEIATSMESTQLSAGPLEHTENALLNFNWGILFIFIAVGLLITYAVSRLPTNPIFFFASMIVLAVTIVLSAIMSNAYLEFTQTAGLAASVDKFNLVGLLMDNYPIFVLAIGALIIIVLYGKQQERGGF